MNNFTSHLMSDGPTAARFAEDDAMSQASENDLNKAREILDTLAPGDLETILAEYAAKEEEGESPEVEATEDEPAEHGTTGMVD